MVNEEFSWRLAWCEKHNLDDNNDIHWHISGLAYHNHLNKQRENSLIGDKVEHARRNIEVLCRSMTMLKPEEYKSIQAEFVTALKTNMAIMDEVKKIKE